VPFHTEQLRLSGLTEEQITEAAGSVLQSGGTSAYLAGIGYSVEKFRQELDAAVNYIKSQKK
jgi:hypothetical protein